MSSGNDEINRLWKSLVVELGLEEAQRLWLEVLMSLGSKEADLVSWIRANTKGATCVVDLGAAMGERLKMVYQPAKKIGIEIFPPYVCQFWTEARAIHGDMREWWRWIDDSECDTAMMIDTIEHIPKNDGLKLIASLQAKFKRILVFTPSGFYLQDSDPTGNENEYQVHESGWTKKELEDLGFSVIEDPNFHEAKECGALFGVWTREQ